MSDFTEEQIAALRAPLARENVKERTQAGRTLSYIEGWVAITEANRIFGFGGWDRETVECKCVAEQARKIGRDQPRDGWGVSYVARVRVTVRPCEKFTKPVIREGTGYGSGIDVDVGSAHESAIKEAETDAMKRALMTFGNPFGLALYDKRQAEVAPAERQAPRAGMVRAADVPPQPHDNGNRSGSIKQNGNGKPVEHPKRQEALDAYAHIAKALKEAKTPAAIEELIKINAKDLALVKEVHAESYDMLMRAANNFKTEMYGATG